MVAVITGNGLGLGNTSLGSLGQSLGDPGTLGQAKLASTLNAATGNLVLQQNADEGLLFDGLPLNDLRTYNSQGQLSGSHGWSFGFSRHLGSVSGALNSAGSTITRTDDDGSAVVYTYDSASGLYLSNGQSGAQDSLDWNTGSSSWTWTNGSSRQQEAYNATGQLTTLSSAETGASFSFSYINNQLSQIAASDGDILLIGYNTSGQLVSLTTQEVPPGQTTAVTRQQVSYGYDTQGRLTTVTTMLASDTDTSATTNYATVYIYDGSSDRIASVTQSDGTTISYSYTEDAQGAYQVTGIITGSGEAAQALSISYSVSSTMVTDAMGNATVYQYNAAGDLTAVVAPAVNGAHPTTSYTYDTNGNLLTATDPDGALTSYQYDANGNLLSVEDGDGNTTGYTYNADNQVLTKTIYSVPAQGIEGQSGYVAPSDAKASYFVYDANDRLRFAIDAGGSVSETQYNASGLASLTRTFAGATYNVSSLSTSNTPDLASVTSWASQQDLTRTTLVSYTYDVRGQLASMTAWDAVDATGAGINDSDAAMTQYVYDAQGRLLQQITLRALDRSTKQVVSYGYDGLGRPISTTDQLGNTTSYVYIDSASTLAITQANGLTTTKVYNSAGLLVSNVQSASGLASRTTNYFYNASGEQVAQIDPAGNVSYTFYDAEGRVAGTVDATGAVTATTYDADGRPVQIVQYAALINTGDWISNGALTASLPSVLPRPTATAADRTSTMLYDKAGQVLATIDAVGNVAVNQYDGTGNLVAHTAYAIALTGTQQGVLGATPALTSILADIAANEHQQGITPPNAADRTTYYFYDAANRQIGKVDPTGYLSTVSYDAAGRPVKIIAYANGLSATQVSTLLNEPNSTPGSAVTLAAAVAEISPSGNDQISRTYYDDRSQALLQIDADGYVVASIYRETGNPGLGVGKQAVHRHYAQALTQARLVALTGAETPASIVALVSQSQNALTRTDWDADGRVLNTFPLSETMTSYTYDAIGNLSAITVTPGWPNPVQTTVIKDDAYSDVLTQTDPTGATTTNTYDALGQVTSTTDALGNTRWFYRDADGRLAYIVQGQLAGGVANTSGEVTAYSYNAFGQVIATTTYGISLNLVDTGTGNGTSINAGVADTAQVAAAVAALGTSAEAPNVTRAITYTGNGQVATSTDGDGYETANTYDAFGDLIQTQQQLSEPGNTLSTANTVSTKYIYDTNGRMVASIDAYGDVIVNTYDDAGRVTATTSYATPLTVSQRTTLGSAPTLAALQSILMAGVGDLTTRTIYDADGNAVASIDPAGNVTTSTYNSYGEALSVTQYATALTASQLGTLGPVPTLAELQAIVVTSNQDQTSRFGYSAGGLRVTSTNSSGQTNYLIYDNLQRLAGRVDANGNITTYVYDADNRVTQTTQYTTALTSSGLATLAGDPELPTLQSLIAALPVGGSGDPNNRISTSIYNAAGEIVATIDTGWFDQGSVTTMSYDGAGNLTSTTRYATLLTTSLGSAPTWSALQTALTTSANDRTTQTIYDAEQRPVATIDAAGYVTTMVYDGNGQIVEQTAYANALTSSLRDALGSSPSLVALQADLTASAQDQKTRNYVDGAGRLVAQVDADGYLTVTNYDIGTKTTTTTRYATALSTAQLNALTGAESATALIGLLGSNATNEQSSVSYDAFDRVTSRTAADGTVTTYQYNHVGQVLSTTTTPANGQGAPRTTSATYDAFGNTLTTTDASGATTTYTYNALNQRSETTDALGNSTWYIYDADGQLLYAIQGQVDPSSGNRNALGNVTAYSYNAFGQVTATTAYAGQLTLNNVAGDSGTMINPATATAAQLAAALAALPASSNDANATTLMTYYTNGDVATSTDGDGYQTIYAYDAFGERIMVEQQSSVGIWVPAMFPISTYSYDSRGELVNEIDGATSATQRSTSHTYDAFGRVSSASVFDGNILQYSYDNLGRQLSVSQLVGGNQLTTQTSYDAYGRVLGQTDAAGAVTTYQYDLATHTTIATTPDGVVTRTARNAYGDTVAVTDSAGNTTAYTYDGNGRLLTTTDALGAVSTNLYDADGNLIRNTDGAGQVATYTYDASGRMLSKVVDPSGQALTTTYQYDGTGRELSVTDPMGMVTAYTYDADGNVLTQVQDAGTGHINLTTTYTYDGAGNVLTKTVGSGVTVSTTQYVYDTLGQLTQVIVDPAGLKLTTSYIYDANGNQIASIDPNGNSTYTIYNEADEAVYSITPAGAQGSQQGALIQYSYDADGRVTSSRTFAKPVDMSGLDTLASGSVEANLSLGSVLVSAVSASNDAVSYSVYDADGRLIYAIDPSGAVTETRYNVLGQVSETLNYAAPIVIPSGLASALQNGAATASDLQVALSDAGDSDSNARVGYAFYDADGRTVYTVQLNEVNGVLGGVVNQTQYDGAGRVIATIAYGVALPLVDLGAGATTASISQALAQTQSAATTRITQYLYDTAGRQAAQIDPNGNTSFTLYDSAGRVAVTVDANGNITTYTRDGMGRVTQEAHNYFSVYQDSIDTDTWISNGVVTELWNQVEPSSFYEDRTTLTTYDAQDRISTISNKYFRDSSGYEPDGTVETITYDAASRIVQKQDVDLSGQAATRVTRYFYDADGQQVASLDANGYLTAYTYDAAGQLTQTVAYATATDPAQRAAGNLAQLTPVASTQDEVTTGYYDAFGNTVGTLDGDGYFTQYTYDADDRLLATTRYATVVPVADRGSLAAVTAILTGAANRQTINAYDAYGDLQSSQNAEGTITQYSYDHAGRVLQTTLAAGTSDARSSGTSYDAFGDVISTTDGDGNVSTYAYDPNGNKTSATDAEGNTTWYAYDANGQLCYTVRGMADAEGNLNAQGEVTHTEYDAFGDVINTDAYSFLIPLGPGFDSSFGGIYEAVGTQLQGFPDHGNSEISEVAYQYNQAGQVIYKTDANNNTTYYQYDGFGDRIEVDLPSDATDQASASRYTYDAMGRLTDEVDGINQYGGSYGGSYSGSGSGTDTSGLRELQWSYDAFGRVATYTDGDGATTSYSYDDVDQQLSQSLVVQGALRESSTAYDAYGRVASTIDALGLVTTYSYDDANRSVTMTTPGGLSTTTARNREGQTIAITDAGGNTTGYQYDADGLLLHTLDADGTQTSNQYDQDGNLIQGIDADGHVVDYAYDAAGRVLTQTIDPNGLHLVTTYVYDGRGLNVKVTDPTGVVTTYAYDDNGNVAVEVDNAGGSGPLANQETDFTYNARNQVTGEHELGSGYHYQAQNTYDALGRLTSTQPLIGPPTSYAYDADGNVIRKTDGDGNSTYYFYDAAGEQIYAVAMAGKPALTYASSAYQGSSSEGQPATVTQSNYDADGHLLSTTHYANFIAPYDFYATFEGYGSSNPAVPTLAQVAGVIAPSAGDATSYQIFNANGQLQYSIDPTGAVVETRYNAAGQVSETLAYAKPIAISTSLATALAAGTANASDMQAALAGAQDSDATARSTFQYYDAMGRVRFSIQSAVADGVSGGQVTETQYDADGNALAVIRYGQLLPLSDLGSTTATATVTQLLSGATDKHVSRVVYDAAGRQVYAIDANNNVTETRYDNDGRVSWTIQYAQAIAAPSAWTTTAVAAAVQASNPDINTAHVTGNVYDALGNVVQTLDGFNSSPVAVYTYNQAGQKVSYTDRDGQVWTYVYSEGFGGPQGLLIGEISPAVAMATYAPDGTYQGTKQQAITTQYGYDNAGRLNFKLVSVYTSSGYFAMQTTTYAYDAAGNAISTNQYGESYDETTGTAIGTIAPNLITHTTYDAFNHPVVSQDANGNYSYNVYDHDGRLAYAVDNDGYVTGYQYDAYGEQTAVTRYADAIDTSSLTDWSTGQPLSLEQLQIALAPSAADRTISTAYDAQGRKLSVTQPAITYTKSDGSTATGSPVTQYTYDAYGNLTSQATLVQGTPGQSSAVWATTYNYYDALGQLTMTVDPLGYVTTSSYDAFGNVVSSTEWATAISTNGLVAGGTQPANPPAGNPAITGADRITTTTYDSDNRKASESVLRSYVDASGATVQGYVTTTYGYDNEGRVSTVTENGQTVTTLYDALGRISSVTGPQEKVLVSNWQALLAANPALDLTSPSLYTTGAQVMSYTYDIFGNKLTQTQGSTVAGSPSVTTYYQYDSANRLVASVTPLDGGAPGWSSDQAVHLTYDNNGNLLSSISTLTGDDGSTVTVTTNNTYDSDNQRIASVTQRSNATTPDKATATQYDAFGEVIASGDGVFVSQTTTYDNAGNKLSATDPKTGALHTYGYNLAGQLISDSVPLSAAVGGSATTVNTLDLDGRIIAEQGPATNAASGANSGILHASYDCWGNVLSSTDAAGNITTYAYNERNQVVLKTEAAVAVVGIDGVSHTTTPTTLSAYNIDGVLIQTTDENGNVTRTIVDGLGRNVQTIDGAGASSYAAYDALGNEVADQDGNGNVSFKNVDALGRVVQQGDFVLSSDGTTRSAIWRQAYVLDQNGDRIVSYDGIGSAYLQGGDITNATLHASYAGYDSQGHVIWSQDAAQRAASVSNAHGPANPGTWTQAPTNADFSDGLNGWGSNQGWSAGDFGDGPYGEWTASFTGSSNPDNPGGSESSMSNLDRVPVVPGQAITASGWFVVNGDHGGGLVVINWYAADGSFISSSSNSSIVTAGNGPGESTITANAPSNAAYAELGVGANNYENGSVYCSGVTWTYVPPAGATSTGADGSIITWLPTGSFTQQPANPDFEDGDTGWDKGPGWSIDQASNTSNGSWVAVYQGNSAQVLTNTDRVPVTPGQSISASVQVSLDTRGGGTPLGAVLIQWYDASGNLLSQNVGNFIYVGDQGRYHPSTVTATAPPGAAYAALGVIANGNGIGSTVVDAAAWNYQYIPTAPTGVVQDTYVYNQDGQLVSQTTADHDTETWQYNANGQVVAHTDLSGAQYHYTYDASSGQLTGESDNWSPTTGGNTQTTPAYVTAPISTPNSSTDTYYADGQLATQTYADGSVYSYSYDANGNLTRQESTTRDGNNQLVHTVTTSSYDSHNRLSHVVQTNVLTGATVLDESFSYDAAGNRREVSASSNGTAQQAWYTYDGDNRVVVSDGTLSSGQILVSTDANSYAQNYDANGNVVSQRTVNAAGDTLLQRNYYDSRNELIRADYAVDLTTGGVSRGVEETRTYDADGHALITQQYYALGTTLGARPPGHVDPDQPDQGDDEGSPGTDVGGELSTATIDFYDSVGRLAEEQNFGHASDWDGTGGGTASGTPDPNATTYGSLGLQNEVVYQGPNGSAGYDADGDVVAYQYRDSTGRVDQYQVTYLRKDGYLQADTSGQNVSGTANVQPSTDESVYDNRGNLVALAQHTQYAGGSVADTVRVFAYDGNGQIIERRDGTADGSSLNQGSDATHATQHYAYVNGQQVAHYDDGGTLDVLSEVTAFSSTDEAGSNGYVVQAGDSLQSIAQAQYGDANLWYIIAAANALDGNSELAIGQRLTIPQVTTSSNTASTFKPYDPSAIVGSTTPNLPTIAPPPPPSSHHCNALAAIIVIAVAVVVSVVSYGALAPEAAAWAGSAIAGGVIAGAAAGAAASVASQLTGDALGVHQGFSFGELAEGAIGGAIGGGVAGALQGTAAFTVGSIDSSGLTAAQVIGLPLNAAGDTIVGAASYIGSDVAGKLTNQPAHFSWAGLVAGSLSSGLGGVLGDSSGARAIGSVVGSATGSALGDHKALSWEQIAGSVAGNVLGGVANDAVNGKGTQAASNNAQSGAGQTPSDSDDGSDDSSATDSGLHHLIQGGGDDDVAPAPHESFHSLFSLANASTITGDAGDVFSSDFGASSGGGLSGFAGAGSYGNGDIAIGTTAFGASSLGLQAYQANQTLSSLGSGNTQNGITATNGAGAIDNIAYSGMPLNGKVGSYVDFLNTPDDAPLAYNAGGTSLDTATFDNTSDQFLQILRGMNDQILGGPNDKAPFGTFSDYSSLLNTGTLDQAQINQTDASGTPYLFQAARLAANLSGVTVVGNKNEMVPFNEAYSYEPGADFSDVISSSTASKAPSSFEDLVEATIPVFKYGFSAYSGLQDGLNSISDKLASYGNSMKQEETKLLSMSGRDYANAFVDGVGYLDNAVASVPSLYAKANDALNGVPDLLDQKKDQLINYFNKTPGTQIAYDSGYAVGANAPFIALTVATDGAGDVVYGADAFGWGAKTVDATGVSTLLTDGALSTESKLGDYVNLLDSGNGSPSFALNSKLDAIGDDFADGRQSISVGSLGSTPGSAVPADTILVEPAGLAVPKYDAVANEARLADPLIANSETTNALTNLGEANQLSNNNVLNNFASSPSPGFSGVYNPETGQFIAYPSGGTLMADGSVPTNLVSQQGGHFQVNQALSSLLNVDPTSNFGFSFTFESDNTISIGFNSRTLNITNPLGNGSRTVPSAYQQQIIDVVQKATGLPVKVK